MKRFALGLLALALTVALVAAPARAGNYGRGGVGGNFRTFNTFNGSYGSYGSYGYVSPTFVAPSFYVAPSFVVPSYVVGSVVPSYVAPSVTYAVPATSYGTIATNAYVVPATVASAYGYSTGFSTVLFNGSFYHAGTGVYVGNAFNTHLHSLNSAGRLSRR